MSYSAQLNNLGVTALEQNRYEVATRYLKEALDVKVSNIDESILTQNGDSQPTEPAARHNVHAIPQCEERDDNFQWGACSNSTLPSCSPRAFIYRKGFRIYPCSKNGDSKFVSVDTSLASPRHAIDSAFLLFNMGLASHLQSEQSGFSTHQMKKGTSLYKMALGLVKDVLDSSGSHLVDYRLVIAILNNLGEIHYEQGHYQLSKRCFHHLSEVLISMSLSGISRNVDQNDWAGLVMNTVMLSEPKVAPAA